MALRPYGSDPSHGYRRAAAVAGTVTRRAAAGGSAAGGSRSCRPPGCPPHATGPLPPDPRTTQPTPPPGPDRPPQVPARPHRSPYLGGGAAHEGRHGARATDTPANQRPGGAGPDCGLSLWLSCVSLKVYPTPPLTSAPD